MVPIEKMFVSGTVCSIAPVLSLQTNTVVFWMCILLCPGIYRYLLRIS